MRKGQSVIPISETNMSEPAHTTQIRLARRTASYWRVTFDNPPLNIFGPETMPQLNEIVTALETDEHVKVVVFDSAVDGFFLTHYNFLAKLEDTTSLVPGPTGLSPLPDMLVRLSRAPVVSIASIRGRATGVGSELALASDMRFASRRRPSCRNGKLVPAWFQAADLWPDYPGSWAEEGRWKCCWAQTIFEAISPSFMATSIVLYPTRSSMISSTRWRCALLRSTSRPSLKRKILPTLQACRRMRKLLPSGTHVLPLFSARPAGPESTNCWSVASTSRETLKVGWDTTWVSSAAEVPSKLDTGGRDGRSFLCACAGTGR
jgi:hypothetical protein